MKYHYYMISIINLYALLKSGLKEPPTPKGPYKLNNSKYLFDILPALSLSVTMKMTKIEI